METRRGIFLLGGLVLLHLAAISHQVDRGGGSLLERGVLAAFSPAQAATAAVVARVTDTWKGYVALRSVHQDNARLQQRLRVLELALQRKQHLAREAQRLQEVLGLRQKLPMETLVAEVIARDGVPWFRTFLINRGTKQGVTLNSPVLSPTGVLGRVIGVGPSAAKVQLLLDRDASVGVLIARTRVAGVTSGQVGLADAGSRELIVKYVPALADVVPGDAVVTSGLDQIFPKGLMVGRVVRVGGRSGLFKDVYVSPSAHFDALEEVLVVRSVPSDIDITEVVR